MLHATVAVSECGYARWVSSDLFQTTPVQWRQLLKQYWPVLSIVLGLTGVLLAGGDIVRQLWWQPAQVLECPSAEQVPLATPAAQLTIDIRGEVEQPGVYRFDSSSRLADAIEKAGGFTKQAHTAYILHTLNLAAPLVDGQKLYIPNEDETRLCAGDAIVNNLNEKTVAEQPAPTSGLVSLNNSSQSELETLTGIGAKRAADIIAARPYQSIDDLVTRSVLSATVFAQIRDFISL